MNRILLAVLILGAAQGCGLREPSASEIFNLRTKCAQLVEQMPEAHEGRNPNVQNETHTSHFDPKTNRCYAEFDEQKRDLDLKSGLPLGWETDTFLYDAQTHDLLAWTSVQGDHKAALVARDSGLGAPPGYDMDYDTAQAIINKTMADDRTRK